MVVDSGQPSHCFSASLPPAQIARAISRALFPFPTLMSTFFYLYTSLVRHHTSNILHAMIKLFLSNLIKLLFQTVQYFARAPTPVALVAIVGGAGHGDI